jgi:cytochrome c556
LLAAVNIPVVVYADDEDTINNRMDVMKTMDEQAKAIDQILQQKAPPDNFATHLQILAIAASTAKKAFEPKVPGGESKPDVWAKWPDFSKRLDDMAASTAALAKTAEQGGIQAAGPKVKDTLACKGCHDIYREEKKQP